MAGKETVYKRIKIAGLISFIPFVLAAGPLGGFFLGEYLQKKLRLPAYVLFIGITIGLVAGVRETVRIIRIVTRMNA